MQQHIKSPQIIPYPIPLPVLAPPILPYHISKTFNFQALNLSLLNVRGLQILKFCRPFNNYSESDNLICINWMVV